jgi:hypothetical protein
MFNMPYSGIPIKDVVRYLPRIIEEEPMIEIDPQTYYKHREETFV